MKTDFSTISNLDFNKVWARDNYVNCNKTDNEKSASKPYPILNEKFKVSPETFAAGFNQKIPEAIPVEFDNIYVGFFLIRYFSFSKKHTLAKTDLETLLKILCQVGSILALIPKNR